jgi:hypothetical protein
LHFSALFSSPFVVIGHSTLTFSCHLKTQNKTQNKTKIILGNHGKTAWQSGGTRVVRSKNMEYGIEKPACLHLQGCLSFLFLSSRRNWLFESLPIDSSPS